MDRVMRKTMERNLPQPVLDYLTCTFDEHEKMGERIRHMEERLAMVVEESQKKDKIIANFIDEAIKTPPTV